MTRCTAILNSNLSEEGNRRFFPGVTTARKTTTATTMRLQPRLIEASRRVALVVEDDPQLRNAMGEQFERMAFDVLAAGNYHAALRHLVTRAPHVVCIHVRLPCHSGYELCEHIRGSLALQGPAIVMTSDCRSPQDMAYAEEAGANAFLHRPFSMQGLTACVASLLEAPRWGTGPTHELQLLVSKPSGYAANRNAARAESPATGGIPRSAIDTILQTA